MAIVYIFAFIEIRHEEETSERFEREGYLQAWTDFPLRYPVSWSKVEQLLSKYPTTKQVESGFSEVTRMMAKELTDCSL